MIFKPEIEEALQQLEKLIEKVPKEVKTEQMSTTSLMNKAIRNLTLRDFIEIKAGREY